MTGSFVLSLFCLRVCLLVCIVLAIISTPSLGEINKHDRNKAKEISDSIQNSEKSVIFPHQSKDNKVNYIYIIEIISILD